ncbi:3D domain-containing protein [Paenibacillus urinalis]|uniref:3D domain-containing protein n=1 Tax=Paenibacillus urinalis TaxID=521520 RepID=A0AAX3N3J7_9BACL|nr:3D domain-containing protein [Paenibacillus urinalis]WDH84192.1 3D domain-containing protein [Paenibacillus urinalis]WDH95635.1 3D domain-containing protein [Paenibacillus urinalis]WDI03832.1 3D domain-containing protein [Paenibacillus urinalis]
MEYRMIRRRMMLLQFLLICFFLLCCNPQAVARDSEKSEAVLAPKSEQVLHTINVTATGYTAGYESTGKRPNHPEYGITYSGVKVHRNKEGVSTIAADPKVFPLGTVLYIPGYGYGIVADTGSAIKGSKIDLYFPTTKAVYSEWGKRDVQVQVVKQGNGKCTEQMIKQLGEALTVNKFIPDALLDKEI